MSGPLCLFADCGRRRRAKGLCAPHYKQQLAGRPLIPVRIADPEARFWAKVNKDGPTMPGMDTPCWAWTGAATRGYGQFKFEGRQTPAHRFAYALIRGAIPAGLCVLHACDNPGCVRHLFCGTNQDNATDRERKMRGARGERGGNAKLTESQVGEIRSRVGAGESRCAVASDYGVSPSCVSYIILNKRWRHVQ